MRNLKSQGKINFTTYHHIKLCPFLTVTKHQDLTEQTHTHTQMESPQPKLIDGMSICSRQGKKSPLSFSFTILHLSMKNILLLVYLCKTYKSYLTLWDFKIINILDKVRSLLGLLGKDIYIVSQFSDQAIQPKIVAKLMKICLCLSINVNCAGKKT